MGTKITADGDCSHDIKRSLLVGRKVMTNLDSIFNDMPCSMDASGLPREPGPQRTVRVLGDEGCP